MIVMEKIRKMMIKLLQKANPYKYLPICSSHYTSAELSELDKAYLNMYNNHISVHTNIIKEMNNKKIKKILEVACGTGWNSVNFNDLGIDYTGLDISETALSMAMVKYPNNKYLNFGINDCSIIKDGSFDAVYSSSMLEHIGYYKEAIFEMLRISKDEVWLLFFEGLSDSDENSIVFHAYSDAEINGDIKDIYGKKIVLQDHIHENNKGWYWNRYSKKKILELFDSEKYNVELLDRSNRNFINDETILIIKKL